MTTLLERSEIVTTPLDKSATVTTLLDTINAPMELKRLAPAALDTVAAELRDLLIRTIPAVGGHFSANLGTVELTVALHYVFSSPWDKLVWDVGHQAYPHKILTGRRNRLGSIRQLGGLSGFLARDESPYDSFGAGHAGTSISAALGMAVARDLCGGSNHVVAIIGDGALTGGMALEALNNLGHLGTRLIVILNDNGMSIAPNVGALATYLDTRRVEPAAPSIWEELGLVALGPVDGHNVASLVAALQTAQAATRPVLLHVITQKGKGYAPAEADPVKWHAVAQPASSGTPALPAPKYQDVFADTLIHMGRDDARVVAVTAAMPDGTSLSRFGSAFPDRLFDVGIAEQHAVTFAAGLAAEGLRPCVAIYSTFLQRAYDQVIHDVCIQNLPVFFALDRGGIVGDDGRTHQGVFDISYLRPIPNMVIMAPKDENELQHMIYTGLRHNGPAAVRYPRGAGEGVALDLALHELPIGKGEVLREGSDIALVALGSLVYPALAAADLLAQLGITATVVNARFAKPLDTDLLTALGYRCDYILTLEENAQAGGFGSAVLEFFAGGTTPVPPIGIVGVPDQFIDHGPQAYWRDHCDLSPAGIVRAALARFPDLQRGPLAPLTL